MTQPAATYVRAGAPVQAGIGAGAATATTAGAGYAVAQKQEADHHAIETAALKTMQFGTLLMPVVFIGDLLTRGLGFVAHKGIGLVSPSAGKTVKSWIRAPYEALHHTSPNDLGSLGSNFRAAKTAIAKDGKLTEGFAETLVSNTARSKAINDGFARVAVPVGKPIAGALDALDNTGPMKWIADKITGFAERREATLIGKGKDATRWTNMKGFTGFGALLKNLPTKIGNAKMFGVLGMVGALAGTGVMLLGNHRANREDKEALREFAADVYGVNEGQLSKKMLTGDQAHPLVAEASKIYDKNVSGRRIMDTFGVVGMAATGGNLLGTNPAPMLVAADMGIPMIGELFNHENPTLGIYSALKKAEAGQINLAPEQKTQAVAQLLTTVPAIAKNAGMHNDYVMPVADAMVKQGMSTSQIVQTIANPVAFQKISSDVIAKVDQERQALVEKAKQEAAAKAQESAAAPTMLAAAAPGKHAQGIEHKGMVGHAASLARH